METSVLEECDASILR